MLLQPISFAKTPTGQPSQHERTKAEPKAPSAVVVSGQYQPLCSAPQTREDAEYCQEWRATKAAEKQTEWAFYQFIASVVGIVAVIATLFYTAKAVNASQRSAQAAEDAVSKSDAILIHSEKTAKEQLRAYVGVIGFDVEMPDPEINRPWRDKLVPGTDETDFFWVKMRNAGQTPALKVRNFQGSVVVDFRASAPHGFTFPVTEQEIPGNSAVDQSNVMISELVIPPGGFYEARFTIINRDSMQAANRKEKTIIIYGRIQYDDIYGDDHYTKYCFVYEPWRSEGRRYIPYDMHNEAT